MKFKESVTDGKIDIKPFKVMRCPTCGYVIHMIEYLAFAVDFGCPRCKTSLYKFNERIIESPNKQEDSK